MARSVATAEDGWDRFMNLFYRRETNSVALITLLPRTLRHSPADLMYGGSALPAPFICRASGRILPDERQDGTIGRRVVLDLLASHKVVGCVLY